MGMFPPQNYGDDFNKSFIGMGNFINGMNRTADDQTQRGIENARADRTLAAQEASSKATVEHSEAQTEKLKRENESAALLQQVLPVYSKVANDEPLNDDDATVLGKVRVKLPYLSNNLADSDKMREAHNVLIAANERAKALPPSDKPYKFERGDSPELDKVLDSWNTVIAPERHKTHIDATGEVTGIKGAEYSTDQIQAGAGFSSEGGAHTAAYFSIVDANGAPIYQTDAQGNPIFKTDQAGKPVLDSEGQPTLQRKLVAASIGQTNDKNAPVDFVPADALIMKSKFALEQLDAESKLDPERKKKFLKAIETNMYGLVPGGAEKLLAAQVKDDTPVVLGPDSELRTKAGKLLAVNPKTATKGDRFKTEEGVSGKPGWVQDVYTDGDGKEIKRGSPRLQFNPRPDGNKDDNRAAKDISIRLRDAQRGYQNAMRTGDPDAINESINMIESLNDSAREYKVTPQPVPARPFTSAENDTIKAQAVKNLEEQRSRAAKVFGLSPSVPAINQEIRRLKQTVKPGKVSFGDPQANTAAAATPPPASQHAGRTIQDDTTGKKYRSDGSRWVEVR